MIDSNKNNQFSEVDVELPSVENASKGETSKKDITIELDLRKTKPLPKLDNRKRILQELVSNDTYLNSIELTYNINSDFPKSLSLKHNNIIF